MSLYINHNSMASAAALSLGKTQTRLESSVSKLSSGLRINSAADDPTGLAISETLRRQVRGLGRAGMNAQDGISMLQVADSALSETQNIISRMRELAVQSANDTLSSNDRLEIQNEIEELKEQIDSISHSTEFNTKKLLNGSRSAITSSDSSSINAIARGRVAENGTYTVSLATVYGGISQIQDSAFLFRADSTQANANTKLSELSNFYDENNNFLLEESQNLTISGNGRSKQITIDGQMTLKDFAASLQDAINSGLNIKGSQVTIKQEDTSKAAHLSIISGINGGNGDISIAGNTDLLDSLSFDISRESQESLVSVTMKDVYGNSNNVLTSEGLASGLLDGVDVLFSSKAAHIAGNGGIVDGIEITSALSFDITLTSGTTQTLNIGAGNWSLEGLTRNLNSQLTSGALNSDNFAASNVNGQIEITGDKNFEIGASDTGVLDFRNGSYSGFAYSSIQPDSFISGVTKFNESADSFDVKFKINDVTITAYSTVTVATTADLKTIDELITETNSALGDTARFDIINNSLVFTDYQVGEKSNNKSYLTLSSLSSDVKKELSNKYGLNDITNYGQGTTNATLRIIDTSSQYQIGSNFGDNLRVAVGNMSSMALGLDKLDLTSISGAEKSISIIDKAAERVSSERTMLGAYVNRLTSATNVASNSKNLLSKAESNIRDVDMASEIIEFTRNQFLSEAGTTILGQANSFPKNVLKLLDIDFSPDTSKSDNKKNQI